MGADDHVVDSWIDEFRQQYQADARNAARQTFEEYWGWVRSFLVEGGAGQRGWLQQGDDVLGRVGDAATARELRARMQDIGKAIAAEWAKQSRYRRIHSTLLQGSPNLFDWGQRLKKAASEDTGDGASLARALDAIERDVRKALRG